jgi:hypothetical protein
VAIVAAHGGAVTVIHRRGVDAVLILPILAGSGPLAALIRRSPASAPSISSPAAGGSSWSCVHIPHKLFRTDFKLLQKLSGARLAI